VLLDGVVENTFVAETPLLLLLQLVSAFVEQAMAALDQAHGVQQHNQEQEQEELVHSCTGPALSCADILQYLPLPGEVQNPFFARTCAGILQSMQHKACILSASGTLRLPAQLLLPDPLLMRPGGQLLINNAWLQKGLAGREYVHPELLGAAAGSEHQQRVVEILLHLGSSKFDSSMLVDWLNAADARHLLDDMQLDERTRWLQDLFFCLRVLKDQPGSSSLSMQDSGTWGKELSAAPILQLHGSKQLVSFEEIIQSEGRLYLWDDRLGGEEELSLFSSSWSSSSSSSSLLFVDPSTLGSSGKVVLEALYKLQEVRLPQLVATILDWQGIGGFSHQQQLQWLLFLFRNRSLLANGEAAGLCPKLQLRVAGGDGESYSRASSIVMPLVPSGAVPAELEADLLAASVIFLHPQYKQLWEAAGAWPEFELWLEKDFGVRKLSVLEAARGLAGLYRCGESSACSVKLIQHMRHLAFLVRNQKEIMTCMQTRKALQSDLLVYGEEQVLEEEGPALKPAKLCWPLMLSASEGIKQQLRHCGVVFLNPAIISTCSREQEVDAAAMKNFFVALAGVQELGPDKVS
jgi:hypothetical protein